MAATATIVPTERLRRSPVYRLLLSAGATFTEINGAAVAADFGAAEVETDAARRMGLADLSPLPRAGFKGRGALDWARDRGVEIGDANNAARRQPGGELALRLADTEVLVIDSLEGTGALPHRLAAEWSMDDAAGSYPVNRQGGNFWFIITGEHAPAVFAKLCAVDLRPAKFPAGAIAQTSVARMSAIVVRNDLGDTPAFHLMGDSASAEYLWGCLLDAMDEFEGRPIGIEALRRLDTQP